jgi:hypothetical protein
MKTCTKERLEQIVTSLSQHIDTLHACGLHETRRLLAIAKLDLQIRIHDISDAELRALCAALETKCGRKATAEVIEFRARAKQK